MNNISDKILDRAIIDSEIIQETESLKRNDPKFDINLGCGYHNWSLLLCAVFNDRKELVEYLLTDPLINVNHRYCLDDYTALHVCKDVSIIKLFLDRKDLDVNIQNKWGNTGLYWACCWGRKACVRELLLDARINVLIRNDYGKTARDIALEWKYSRIAKILGNSLYTSLLRIPNRALVHDIVRTIIEEYV